MLELVVYLKVVSERQQAQAVCPTKYYHYILGEGVVTWYGSRRGKMICVPSKICM